MPSPYSSSAGIGCLAIRNLDSMFLGIHGGKLRMHAAIFARD